MDSQVLERLKWTASADEDGGFKRQWLIRCFCLVVETEAGDERTALGEAHDAVVWSMAFQVVFKPSVCLPYLFDRGIVPKRVVRRRVEEIYACSRSGGEEAIDKVKGELRTKSRAKRGCSMSRVSLAVWLKESPLEQRWIDGMYLTRLGLEDGCTRALSV